MGLSVKERGFTLIEMLITVAIIAILAAVGVFVYNKYIKAGFEVDPVSVLLSAAAGEEEYRAEHGTYACYIEDIPEFNDNLRDNTYVLNNGTDPRRTMILKVQSCNSTSFVLSVKNTTTDPDWQIEWIISCNSTVPYGECRPQQVKGSTIFKKLF